MKLDCLLFKFNIYVLNVETLMCNENTCTGTIHKFKIKTLSNQPFREKKKESTSHA